MRIYWFIFFQMICFSVWTQKNDSLKMGTIKVVGSQRDTLNGISVQAKTESQNSPPKFPGGNQALMNYLKKNKKYPIEAVPDRINGEVRVAFIIGESGKIKAVRVLEYSNAVFQREAVRLVYGMPNWLPAVKNGKPVGVERELTITFRYPDFGSYND